MSLSMSSTVRLKTEDVLGMSRKKSAALRVASAIHNAQKQFGTDSFRELFSPGLKMSTDASTSLTVLMWPYSHLQTTSDSLLLMLMKTLFLRLTTLLSQKTSWNAQWPSTMYSLTKITSSALMCLTTWAPSTTQMRGMWEPLACQLHLTTHSGFLATPLKNVNMNEC